MSFKFHQESLRKICRICTNRLQPRIKSTSARNSVACKDIMKEIYNVFGVNTWHDNPDQHPTNTCDKCARKIRHYTAGTRSTEPEKVGLYQTIQKEWPPHTRTGLCFVCKLICKEGKGGGSWKPMKSRFCLNQQEAQTSCHFDTAKGNIFEQLFTCNDSLMCGEVSSFLDIIGHHGG